MADQNDIDLKDAFEEEDLVTPQNAPAHNAGAHAAPLSPEEAEVDLADVAQSQADEKAAAREAAEQALKRDDAWRMRNEKKVKRVSLAAGIACGLAVVAGVVSGAMGWRAMQITNSLQGAVKPMVTVTHDIGRGHVLSAQDLSVQEVPSKYAPADAVVAKSTSQEDAQAAMSSLVGAEVTLPISANNPISTGLLQGGNSLSDVTLNVHDGNVAMMLAVDVQSGLVPLLHVGDRVNVISVSDSGARTALKGVKVIALGAALAGGAENYQTVTFDLTPEQAETLATVSSPRLVVLSQAERAELDEADAATWGTDGKAGSDSPWA